MDVCLHVDFWRWQPPWLWWALAALAYLAVGTGVSRLALWLQPATDSELPAVAFLCVALWPVAILFPVGYLCARLGGWRPQQ